MQMTLSPLKITLHHSCMKKILKEHPEKKLGYLYFFSRLVSARKPWHVISKCLKREKKAVIKAFLN